MVVIENNARFRCELGQWMVKTPTSISQQAFTGCLDTCPPGTYGNTSYLTSLECSGLCPPGHYCPAGTFDPIPCPVGRYLEFAGGSSLNSCIRCSPGTFNPAQARTDAGCISCPVGTLSEELESTSCDPCPVGGYCDVESAAGVRQTFKPCPAGTYNPGTRKVSEADCLACPLGTANNIPGSSSADVCVGCLPGSYGEAEGVPTCTRCPAGTYQDLPSATDCKICPAGAFCPKGSATPVTCPPGTEQPEERQGSAASCLGCSAGYWCTGGSKVACLVGFYNPLPDAADETACVRCPTGSTTLQPASTAPSDCVCEPHLFNDQEAAQGLPNCIQCIIGTNCSRVGSALQTLVIERGYWRPSPLSTDVRRCPDSTTGCRTSADTGVCSNSMSGCKGIDPVAEGGGQAEAERRSLQVGGVSSSIDAQCENDLSGAFCRACPRNVDDVPWVHYQAATQTEEAKCASCDGVVGGYFGLWVGLVAAVFAVLLAARLLVRVFSADRIDTLRALWVASSPHVKVKVMLGFYFIAARVEDVYEVTLPGPVRRAFSVLLLGFSMGLSDDVSFLTCMGIQGFLGRLAFWICVPIVVVIVLLLGALGRLICAGDLSAANLFYASLPTITRAIFFLYPIVTNVAFESFSCYTFDNGAFSWLSTDVSIDCNERMTSGSEYSKVYGTAWLAIALYPIGLILAFGFLLFRARHAIRHDKPTALSASIAFLHREFEPHFYWWELVEMLRRLVLVGLFVLIERGSVTQLIYATVYCLVHLLVQLQAAPYKSLGNNFLASVSNFALTVLFVCLIMFKVSNTTEVRGRPTALAGSPPRCHSPPSRLACGWDEATPLPLPPPTCPQLDEIQALLSPEQSADLSIDSLTLTNVLIGTLLLSVCLGFVLLVVEVREERENLREQHLYSLARRLRYVDDGHVVVPPRLKPTAFGAYHLFLSHVWGSGQDQMRVVKQRLLEMMPEVKVFLDVDDLSTGRGREYVDCSVVVLIFCSTGYFSSPNCMREALRALFDKKPVIALLEPDVKHGAMTIEQVKEGLQDADGKYEKWGLAREMQEWGMPKPTPEQMFEHMFHADPLEWSRITAFQDVTLR